MAEDLLVLSALVRRELGLDFSEHLDQLERKAASRLAATHCATIKEYLTLLAQAPFRARELHELANVVTNNETYFFREQGQLSVVCGQVVSELLADTNRRTAVKILSVPSSSGEEPYSIAMNLLMNNQPVGTRINIYGADVSDRALEAARAGLYRPLAFRGVAPDIMQRFFQVQGDVHVLDPSVRRLVQFFHANLLDPGSMKTAAPYDIIFCRNVMIYFDAETQQRVIEGLTSMLVPGGYLCLGHADATASLYTFFDVRIFFGSMLYRRKQNPAMATAQV